MELNYCVTYTSNWVRLIGGLLVDVVKGCGKRRRSSSCCCCCRPPVPCCRCCPLKYLLLLSWCSTVLLTRGGNHHGQNYGIKNSVTAVDENLEREKVEGVGDSIPILRSFKIQDLFQRL